MKDQISGERYPDHWSSVFDFVFNQCSSVSAVAVEICPTDDKGLVATSFLLSTSVPSTLLYQCPVRYKSYRYFLKKAILSIIYID